MIRLHKSATLRMALAYTACLTLGVMGLWGGAFWTMRHAFQQQLDVDLDDEADRLLAEFRKGSTPALVGAVGSRVRLNTSDELIYALYDRKGQEIEGNLPHPRPRPGKYTMQFEDRDEGLDTIRVVARDVPGGLLLLVAADSERMDRIDRRMETSFVGALLGVLALGLLGAFLFARLLHDKLGRIALQAYAVADGAVSARMPVSDRGDEFDHLAASLNHMLARIEALIANLRLVSGALAHDLRTPLTRLRQRIEDAADACQEGRVQDELDRATREVEDVLGLFGAILQLSEVEGGGALQMQPFDVAELADRVAETYEPAFAEDGRRLGWLVEPGMNIVGSSSLIAQSLSNLLENASRHTPVGSEVEITLASGNGEVLLSVRDNGAGIDSADRARALERFVRLDAARSTPGFGLGLPLVDAVARRHGGWLELADARPGLRATMHLPCRGVSNGA